MSLLADLLAKLKQPQAKREVPPNLKDIVQSSSNKSSSRKRVILLSVLFIVSVTIGIVLVYIIRPYLETDSSFTVSPLDMAVQSGEHIPSREDKSIESDNSATLAGTKSRTRDQVTPAKNKTVESPDSNDLQRAETREGGATEKQPDQSSGRLDTNQKDERMLAKAPTKLPERRRSRRDSYLYSARKFEMNSDYVNALKNYREALKLDGRNFSIMNAIAYIYLQLGLLEDAIKHSQKALSRNPDYVPALINLAIANAQAANYSVAKKHLSRANFLSPDNETVILNLAILDEQQKMYDSALENYSKLTVLGHSEGLSGMARIYERLGSYEKAIDAYRKIIKSDFFDKKTKINAQKRIMHLTTRRRARQKEIVEKADSDNN